MFAVCTAGGGVGFEFETDTSDSKASRLIYSKTYVDAVFTTSATFAAEVR
jgi:hypothetical protein